MTPTAIKWLMYDMIRWGFTHAEMQEALENRGATYSDLIAYILWKQDES